MKLRVTLQRSNAESANIEITTDAACTVGEVARSIWAADTGSERTSLPENLGIRLHDGPTSTLIDSTRTLAESGITHGARVDVVQINDSQRDSGPAVATLRILSGSRAGQEIPLTAGTTLIGRGADCDIPVDDKQVSKRHVQIVIGEDVEVVDTNSSNGVWIGSNRVQRTRISNEDTVRIGETSFSILMVERGAARSGQNIDIHYNRSPRVVPYVKTPKVDVPSPPRLSDPPHFSWLAMVGPMLMGAGFFAMTRSRYSLVFIVMGPMMMIMSYLDQKMRRKKRARQDAEAFEAHIQKTSEELQEHRVKEREALQAGYPSLSAIVDGVVMRDSLLWSRRPEHPTFLNLRVGRGDVPSHIDWQGGVGEGLPEHRQAALDLVEKYSTVPDAPVVVNLRSVGSLGVCGPQATLGSVARGIMAQVASLHSPAELCIVALTSQGRKKRWQWMEWLPHLHSPHSPLGDHPHMSVDPAVGASLLTQLEGILDARLEAGNSSRRAARGPLQGEDKVDAPTLPALVVLVDNPIVDRARLTRLLEQGPDVGIHAVWVAPDQAELPGACRSFLHCGTDENTVGQVRVGDRLSSVECEALPVEQAVQIARTLAPLVDAGAPIDDVTDVPSSVPLSSLVGQDGLDDAENVLSRWRENRSVIDRSVSEPIPLEDPTSLTAVVGHKGSAPFALDLRSDGPHALVAGTTGAGKSEFLQSWVLAMAHNYSPDRVTFLFVDYKGGAAFSECTKLPHCVGLVTDLSPYLVRRALRSLRAELHYREHLLNAKGKKDLLELELTGDPDCPPTLIIVVDEFAALVGEVPEFVDGVVDVAQRGRSLGLHLILATQRPAGVIKDNLRANTNLRIALRVADEADSKDVVGDNRAAHFSSSIPGRGVAKSGAGRLTMFQSGFPGARTSDVPEAPEVDIVQFDFGQYTPWPVPDRPNTGPKPAKDIERVVHTMSQAATICGIPEPRKPWIESLAEIQNLLELGVSRDDKIVLGRTDDPDKQAQPVDYFYPDTDGNLLIFGTSGSGKSTTLRSLAVAAGVTPHTAGCHVYGLDCAGGGLRMLEQMPHVGCIANLDDEERVTKTLNYLTQVIALRSKEFAAVKATSLAEFRVNAQRPQEPRIFLLLDGYSNFRDAYENDPKKTGNYKKLQEVLSEGRSVGVHAIVTADHHGAVPSSVSSMFQRKLVMRMSNADAYSMLGVPTDVLGPNSCAGRAIDQADPKEMQLALVGSDHSTVRQDRIISRIAVDLKQSIQIQPFQIRSVPEVFSRAQIPPSGLDEPVLGLDFDLQPLTFRPQGTLLVAAPTSADMTAIMTSLLDGFRSWRPDFMPALVTPHQSPLLDCATWGWTTQDSGEAPQDVEALQAAILKLDAATRPAVVIADNVGEFSSSSVDMKLQTLLRTCQREGHLFIATRTLPASGSVLSCVSAVQNARRALVVQAAADDAGSPMSMWLPKGSAADFPALRGYFVNGADCQLVQLPQPQDRPAGVVAQRNAG